MSMADTMAGAADQPKRPGRWPLILLAALAITATIAGIWYYIRVADLESTDDAYIDGKIVSIQSKVSGYIVELNINDNTRVRAGDVLLRIDSRDYVAAQQQAVAAVALAEARLDDAKVDAEIARVVFPAHLTEAEAQYKSASASLGLAQAQERRQRKVDPHATTQEAIDTASAQVRIASATLARSESELEIAKLAPQSIARAELEVHRLEAQLAEAKARLNSAELNLSHVAIRAPQDGWITKRNIEQGSYLQVGQAICTIVTPTVWVTANFKETQLNRMRAGQPVEISVDAFSHLRLQGHIDSFQMGTGSRFTPFPPENATGNWVKIVQRIPVKILIDSGLDPNVPLPLGLSVEATVRLQ